MEKNHQLKPTVIALRSSHLNEVLLYPMECQTFDRIFAAGRGYMYVSSRERGLGLIDWHGRLILDLMWDQISPYFDDNVIIALKGKTFVLFDFEGRTLTGLPLDRLLDGKPGVRFLSKSGELMHASILGDFCDGMLRVKTAAGGGYVDASGHYVMDCPHKFCGEFHDHRAIFEKNNGFLKAKTYGYINRTGGEIIKPVYAHAGEFSEGFAAVKKDGKLGYIDKMGKWLDCYAISEGKRIALPNLARVEKFKNGFARVMTMGDVAMIPGGDGSWVPTYIGNGGWGMISKDGELVMSLTHNNITDANENGICLFESGGRYGLLRVDGAILLKAVFTDIKPLRSGCFALKSEEGWYAADPNGWLIGKQAWEQIGRLPAQGVCVRRDGKWGMMDYTGKIVMPLIYDMDFCLNEDVALVKREGQFMLCGPIEQELSDIRFEDASNLMIGLSLVVWQGKRYLLDYGFAPEKECK